MTRQPIHTGQLLNGQTGQLLLLVSAEQQCNYNKQHVLHPTLLGTMDAKYHLMPRAHNFELTAKNNSITECDFITRMLFKDVY